MKKTVNILGVDYVIETDDKVIKDGADGICHPYSNRIRVRPKGTCLAAMIQKKKNNAVTKKLYLTN